MIVHVRNPFYRRARARRLRGFTLVEILTATAIMALLVSLVMTIINQVLAAWDRSSDDLAIGTTARSALDIISQDIEQAVFRTDGAQWLSCTTEATPDSPVHDVTNTRFIFFSNANLHQPKEDSNGGSMVDPKHNLYGDVCAIEYRVTYGDPFDNANSIQKTFSLHRVVVDPVTTFYGIDGSSTKPIMGVTQGPPTIGKGSLEGNFDDLIDGSRNPVTSTVNGHGSNTLRVTLEGSFLSDSILLANVARFNVFLYYYGTNAAPPPATEIFPETNPFNNSPANYYYGGWKQTGGAPSSGQPNYLDLISPASGGAGSPTFQHLAFADITLTILNDEGVTVLNGFNGSMPQGMTWDSFLQTYGKTYTQRVRFFNSP